MRHELKIHPAYFNAIVDGDKNFEIRKDDKGFQKGDNIELREWNPDLKNEYTPEEIGRYTGRTIGAKIGYVTAYEQQKGYVVFSLKQIMKQFQE